MTEPEITESNQHCQEQQQNRFHKCNSNQITTTTQKVKLSFFTFFHSASILSLLFSFSRHLSFLSLFFSLYFLSLSFFLLLSPPLFLSLTLSLSLFLLISRPLFLSPFFSYSRHLSLSPPHLFIYLSIYLSICLSWWSFWLTNNKMKWNQSTRSENFESRSSLSKRFRFLPNFLQTGYRKIEELEIPDTKNWS